MREMTVAEISTDMGNVAGAKVEFRTYREPGQSETGMKQYNV